MIRQLQHNKTNHRHCTGTKLIADHCQVQTIPRESKKECCCWKVLRSWRQIYLLASLQVQSANHNIYFLQCNTYRGWDDISGTVNVTYFGDESPFTLEEVFSHRRKSSVATRYTDQNRCKRKMAASQVWRKNNPKSNQRPFCVTTRLCGYHAKSIR